MSRRPDLSLTFASLGRIADPHEQSGNYCLIPQGHPVMRVIAQIEAFQARRVERPITP